MPITQLSTRFVACCLALAASASAAPVAEVPGGSDLPRVLFLTHSAGFVHRVVRRPADGSLSHAESLLLAAAEGRFDVMPTQDCRDITAKNLARYDAVLFYTSGDLPITPENLEALTAWVRAGGAFVGTHSATDTLKTYAPYVDMIGGVFDGHPWHEEVTVRVEDADHPATRHLGESFRITDEIYQFRDWSRHPLRVLLALDGASVEVGKGKRADGDYAVSWCKDYGRGRVFYTSLGHRPTVWTDPRFQQHLLDGIAWAIDGPDYSPPAPRGDTVLFDGSSLENWRQKDGQQALWAVADGTMQAVRGAGDLVTAEQFSGDFLLHLEFRVPETPATNGWQDRGNSGVYLQGRYEVQVLDSFGRELKSGDCGGIYGKHAPALDACRPAGEWQSYDIQFSSPRHEDGEKVANARMTVWHNGLRIHDDVEIDGPTTAAMSADEPGRGPILLQDHGHAVRYRNVWLSPR